MNPLQLEYKALTRRHFFGQGALGLGSAALSSLLAGKTTASSPAGSLGMLGAPHFAPKAKRAIYLFMAGAPSQLDLFDHKPKTQAYFDQDLPESVRMGQRLTTMTSGQKRFPIATSKFQFQNFGVYHQC